MSQSIWGWSHETKIPQTLSHLHSYSDVLSDATIVEVTGRVAMLDQLNN